MFEIYQPAKIYLLTLESMILWRGRLLFRQYIKNKHHKYGIKLYELTEADGLVLNTNVYTDRTDGQGGKGRTSRVVMNLLRNSNCTRSPSNVGKRILF